jgi:hypothetical protein
MGLKMKVSTRDVMIRLGINQMQLGMALYSGRLPNHAADATWDKESIEPYLVNWERQLKAKETTGIRND